MLTSPRRTCRTCFAVLLAIGASFVFVGLLVEPILPLFALDRVLAPEELLDPHKRAATMVLLEKAAGNRWLYWTVSGLAIVVTSGIGLRAVRKAEWRDV